MGLGALGCAAFDTTNGCWCVRASHGVRGVRVACWSTNHLMIILTEHVLPAAQSVDAPAVPNSNLWGRYNLVWSSSIILACLVNWACTYQREINFGRVLCAVSTA